MMIRVLYKDNTSGMVRDNLLEALINSGKIVAFHRSSGWVAVGRDPIRKSSNPYNGPERRKNNAIKRPKASDFFG